MLIDPHAENNNAVRVVGIDPGSTNMGFGVIEGDVIAGKVISCSAITLNANKIQCSELDERVHSARYARIFALTEALHDLFVQTRPTLVACESPFMSRRRPMAYGALMETVYAVRIALRRYDSTIYLDLVDPPTAKIAVGAKGNADKDAVLKAVLSLEGGSVFSSFDEKRSGRAIGSLDEHSSDSLAIAYWRWKLFKEQNV